MIIQCGHCATRYKIDSKRIAKLGNRMRCSRCKKVFSAPPPRPRVLIAKESRDFLLSVKELLEDQPFDLLFAQDGVDALEKIKQHQPVLAVLDVALPKMYGFELAEILKSDPLTKDIRIILLAAIHDKTRYKRLPESLYGADDYIEAHHTTDFLLPKICKLLPELFQKDSAKKDEPKRAAEEVNQTSQQIVACKNQEKVERLARIIISDIALYNEEKVENGIRNGDLEERLAPELNEAMEMMKKRFPGISLDYSRDLLHHEIEVLMEKARTARSVS